MKIKDILSEEATAGAMSSSDVGSIPNPHISPGKARGRSSYTGTPGKSGTKSPPQPKVKSVNPHNTSGVSLFGGPAIKR
jgi:hypothetical protein